MARALISVSDKTALVPFASELVRRGVTLVSTGGTARALAEAGLPVTGVSDVTGFPEMLDGRVKTLHPAVHGGILARRSRPDDLAAIAAQGIEPVDLVVVNLYPFAQAAAKPDLPFDDLVEEIDIGGPSLVRAAAKNFRDVLVVVDPADYGAGAGRARAKPAGRRARSASTWRARRSRTRRPTTRRSRARSPTSCGRGRIPPRAGPGRPAAGAAACRCRRCRDLRYGENPHQPAALVRARPVPRPRGRPRAAGQGTVVHQPARPRRRRPHRPGIREPAACGHQAHEPVRRGDGRAALPKPTCAPATPTPLSAFGGIVGLQPAARRRHGQGHRLHVHRMRRSLRPSTPRRCGAGRQAQPAWSWRDFRPFAAGGTSRRRRPVDSRRPCSCSAATASSRPTLRGPTGRRVHPLAGRHETAADGGGVAGPPLRVACLRAREVEHHSLHGCGPHAGGGRGTDEPCRLGQRRGDEGRARGRWRARSSRQTRSSRSGTASTPSRKAGATAVVQPGGSVRDQEVIAAADEHGLAMVFAGRRHFRH